MRTDSAAPLLLCQEAKAILYLAFLIVVFGSGIILTLMAL